MNLHVLINLIWIVLNPSLLRRTIEHDLHMVGMFRSLIGIVFSTDLQTMIVSSEITLIQEEQREDFG